jgi:XrtJ-associated TM-motif-TM protein
MLHPLTEVTEAMKNWMFVLVGCALFLLVAAPLYGQTGCTDSPENPTVVLALVGGAGAMFSAVRAMMKERRRR